MGTGTTLEEILATAGAEETENDTLTLLIKPKFIEKMLKKLDLGEDVTEIAVSLLPNQIEITGIVKYTTPKVLGFSKDLFIPFTIMVEPEQIGGRDLTFRICNLAIQPIKFLNIDSMGWISSKLFHHPPIVSYSDHRIMVNLDGVDEIANVKYGFIKHLTVNDSCIVCTVTA